MFLRVSVQWFFAKVHCTALLSNIHTKIKSCDTSVDMLPGRTLSKSSFAVQGIRQLVDFCLLRVQTHESQHQNKPQYNSCTGQDVQKLATIQQSREIHLYLQHVSQLTETTKIFKK